MILKAPTVFISYAWENDIKRWVSEFATRLRTDGVDARIDRWETKLGDHLPEYMEESIRENDFVLIICTPTYKQKSDFRKGGVGYEGHLITGEVITTANHRKFIPVLRKGDWESSAPSFLASKLYCDLRGKGWHKDNYSELLKTLHGEIEDPPAIGSKRVSRGSNADEISRQRADMLFPANCETQIAFGEVVLSALRQGLPEGLRRTYTSSGATVFIDNDGLQRVKVYIYQTHCKVRVRCSRDWGFRNCRHRKTDRNAGGWLTAVRVDDEESVEDVLSTYDVEWSTCDP